VTCRLPDIDHFTYNISLSNDGKIFKESDPSAPERIIGDSSQIWDECLKQNILKSRVYIIIIYFSLFYFNETLLEDVSH